MSLLIYTKDGCKYCDKAKELCDKYDIQYTTIHLDPNNDEYSKQRQKLVDSTKQTTFPWIYTSKENILEFLGGYTELERAYDTGRLYKLGIVKEEIDF